VNLSTIEEAARRGITSHRRTIAFAVASWIFAAASAAHTISRGGLTVERATMLLVVFGVATQATAGFVRARRLLVAYRNQLEKLKVATYHAVAFAATEQAAAFVAALSQHLHTPDFELPSYEEDVEVTGTIGVDRTTLYLSAGVMAGFTPVFPAPSDARPVPSRDLPPDRIPLLVGTSQTPLDADRVMRRFRLADLLVHKTLRLTAES
jgi:hypothetical protein